MVSKIILVGIVAAVAVASGAALFLFEDIRPQIIDDILGTTPASLPPAIIQEQEIVEDLDIIDIGVMLPSTGDLAAHGQDNNIGVQLGLTDFNSYLEEIGASWRMNLVLEDTQSDPIVALEKIQSLNSKGIKFVLGPESSAEVRNVKSYADSNDMILISPTSTSPSLAIVDNIFRLIPDDTQQGKVLALLFQEEGIKAVVPIYRADVWGDGLYKSTRSNFEALGGVVDNGIRYSPDVTVYSTEAVLLSALVERYVDIYSRDEVAVLMIGFSETVHLLNFADSYELLREVRWFGSDGSSNDGTISSDPIASSFTHDVRFVSTQFATSTNDRYQHVNDYFIDFKGSAPNAYAFSSYDSVWILGKAILETESTDPLIIRDSLIDVASRHTGAIGTVNLNEFGDLAISDYDLWGIENGAWYKYGHFYADSGTFEFELTDDIKIEMVEDVVQETVLDLPEIIDVGVMLPSTGDLAAHGQDNNIGVQLGLTDFNAYLEEIAAPWRMNLILEDTQSDPIVALEKIQSLNSKGIKFVLGPESSAEVRNVKSYADSNDMILISPTSTSPALAIKDNIFRMIPDDTQQGKVLALLFQEEGIRAVIPIYRADVWGDGLYEATRDNFENFGGVMDEGIRYSPEVTVYSAEANLLSNIVDRYTDEYSSDEIAILMIGFSETVHLINSAASYENLESVKWYGSDGSSNDSTLSDDPIASEFTENIKFVSTQFATSDNEIYQHVNDYFIDFKGSPPNAYAFSSYDSVAVLGKTILETQSVNPLVIRDAIIDVASRHTGAIGTVNLNDVGDLTISDYDLWGISNSAWYKYGHFYASDSTFDFESVDASYIEEVTESTEEIIFDEGDPFDEEFVFNNNPTPEEDDRFDNPFADEPVVEEPVVEVETVEVEPVEVEIVEVEPVEVEQAEVKIVQVSTDIPEIVNVGVMLSSIGNLSSHGQDNNIGVQLGLDDFNIYLKNIGASWRMNLVLEDTQSDPIVALEKIQSLNSKGIKFILGPESSAEVRNVKSYADSNDMVLISPTSTSTSLAIEDNIFRLIPDDTQQGRVLALLFQEEGIKAVVPIYRADVWGDGLYESTKNSFEELGGVMDEGIRYSPEVTVYSTEANLLSYIVAKYVDEYSTDEVAVLMIGFSETMHLLNFAASYDSLQAVRWFGSDGSSNDSTLSDDPIASEFTQNTKFVSTQFATSTNEIYRYVNDYFIDFKGSAPNAYAFSSYDSVWVLGKTILEMDTVDPLTIRDAIRDVAADHTGAIGPVNLNEAGDLVVSDYDLWGIDADGWYKYGHFYTGSGTFEFESDK